MQEIKNILAVRSAMQMIESRFEELSPKTTLPQYLVLSAVLEKPLKQREITAATAIDRSTLSAIVKLLARKGFVNLSVGKEDKRTQIVRLSAKGKKIVRDAEKDAAKTDRELSRLLEAMND